MPLFPTFPRLPIPVRNIQRFELERPHFFRLLSSFNSENSDRHTRAAFFFGRQWQVFVLSNFRYSATAQEDTFMFFAAVACGYIWRLPTFARRIEMRDALS
jgi:hypothetical protein